MIKRKVYLPLLLICVMSYSLTMKASTITALNTDKARYQPGDTVNFSFKLTSFTSGSRIYITVFNLDSIVKKDTINGIGGTDLTWKWKAPNYPFNGLLAVFELKNDSISQDIQTIAVDVSADWSQFPRYGFLSSAGFSDLANIPNVMAKLNRYHMNGIQFYDWQNKHHLPLPVDNNGVPLSSWNDISNRTVSYNTVKTYINTCHQYNMKAMAYNLLYGAWANALSDGVLPDWYIYKDQSQSSIDFLPLPGWVSNIYLLDPSNTDWQQYIVDKTKFALNNLGFDGWHIDQVGDRGAVYDYLGQRVFLDYTFAPFINYAKSKLNCPLVMNAVSQFGQSGIASTPVDFLYSEVWTTNNFDVLKTTITDNNLYSQNKLSTVIAGYINYNLSNTTFNTPSVLFADAVIFAHGGSHIELGEHMLHKEYFPNGDVSMSSDLENRIIKYYDFATAYERILCKGGAFETASVISVNTKPSILPFPASAGSVAVIKRKTEKGQVFHFINFTKATTMNWRDDNGIQAKPDTLKNVEVKIKIDAGQVFNRIWVASPDGNGIPQYLNYTIESGYAHVTIPDLQYWTMLVMDNGQFLSVNEIKKSNLNENLKCYPNPFTDHISLEFENASGISKMTYSVFNLTGVKQLEGLVFSNVVQVSTSSLESGTYIVVAKDQNGNVGRKIITCVH